MEEKVQILGIFLSCLVILVYGMPNSRKEPPAPQDILQFKENGTVLMGRNEWRSDACKAQEFLVRLERQSNCEPKFIKNLYCLGKCNSVYIPQQSNENFKSCKACVPSATVEKDIKLQCRVHGRMKVIFRRIEMIKSCKCMEVDCGK